MSKIFTAGLHEPQCCKPQFFTEAEDLKLGPLRRPKVPSDELEGRNDLFPFGAVCTRCALAPCRFEATLRG